jgi:NAD(P)-dependent dehydrogenase (short-subunit alcohol dehydrogenase family)
MSLSGKIILVTGAGVRIGRALALGVARSGAQVVLHYYHSTDEAQEVLVQIHEMGGQGWLLQADLGDVQQTAGLIERACQFGSLYALVNNAAIFEPLTWQDTNLQAWQHHLDINLTAPFLLSQAFARGLQPGQGGRIINLLDWRALRPGADHLPYTISKAALAALTRSMAIALAPHVLVNGIALGAILPPSNNTNDARQPVLARVPAERWAELDEVVQTLIFLLDGPSYITGEVIHLDGGRHLV